MEGRRFEDTWAMEDAFARTNIPQNMRGLRRQCGPNNVCLSAPIPIGRHDPRFGQIALRPLPGYPAARLRQAASVAHPPQHTHRSTSIHVPVQLHFSRVTAFTTSPRARLLTHHRAQRYRALCVRFRFSFLAVLDHARWTASLTLSALAVRHPRRHTLSAVLGLAHP